MTSASPRLSRIEAVLAVGIIVLIAEHSSEGQEFYALDDAMAELGVPEDERDALRRRLVLIARTSGGVGLIGAAQATLQGPDVEYACELISRTVLAEGHRGPCSGSFINTLRETLLAS